MSKSDQESKSEPPSASRAALVIVFGVLLLSFGSQAGGLFPTTAGGELAHAVYLFLCAAVGLSCIVIGALRLIKAARSSPPKKSR